MTDYILAFNPPEYITKKYPAIFTEDCLRVLPNSVVIHNSKDEFSCHDKLFKIPQTSAKKLSNALCAMVEWAWKEGILNGHEF